MTDETGSNYNLIEPSITINEIRISPSINKKDYKKSTNKKESHHSKMSLRKDALSGSTTIASAVSGASSLLSAVVNNKSNPLNNKSNVSSSNYNINIIQNETDNSQMPTSASENILKESNLFKFIENKRQQKAKINSDINMKTFK